MLARFARSLFAPFAVAVLAFAPAAWGESAPLLDLPEGLTLYATDNVRWEFWDFFKPASPGGDHSYTFGGNRLRLGGLYEREHFAAEIAGQYTQLWMVPDDAAGMPGGPLGTGAIYYLHSHDTSPAAVILKYLNFELKDLFDQGINAKVGRMTWSNGLEAKSGVPKIEKLKAIRIKDRVIGEFGWSFFQRSFDGARVWWENDFGQASAAWFMPTEGGFEDGWNRTIFDINIVSASYTVKPGKLIPGAELQFFYYLYDDDRDVTQRVDNTAIKVVNKQDIEIHSIGGHLVGAYDVGPGQLDVLLWGMYQFGEWFELDQRAGAVAVEAGYQFPKVWGKPWIRLEAFYGSGDGSPNDGDHETFFQMVPTVRQYASQASYNLMNSTDFALDLILNPHPKLTIRADLHYLALSDDKDLWYAGAGATQHEGDIFGYIGRPSGGDKDFGFGGMVYAIYRPAKWMTVNAYYGWLQGGDVVENNFAKSDDLNFFFLEFAFKFKTTGG